MDVGSSGARRSTVDLIERLADLLGVDRNVIVSTFILISCCSVVRRSAVTRSCMCTFHCTVEPVSFVRNDGSISFECRERLPFGCYSK